MVRKKGGKETPREVLMKGANLRPHLCRAL